MDANDFFLALATFVALRGQLDFDFASTDNRLGQLRGLVALGQVRIKIIFSFKNTVAANVGIDGQAEQGGLAYRFPVDHWQGARQAQINQ